jgi:hypothetical protein
MARMVERAPRAGSRRRVLPCHLRNPKLAYYFKENVSFICQPVTLETLIHLLA